MDHKPKPGISTRDVKWPLEDNLPYVYANHFGIVDTGHEIVISFGNFLPIGLHRRSGDEIQEYMDKAEVAPVAKIVLSNSGFKAFFQLLKGRIEADLDSGSEEDDD